MKTTLCAAAVIAAALINGTACKKSSVPQTNTNNGGGGTTVPTVDSVYNPSDPAVAASIGFFLNDWKTKSFNAPAVMAGTASTAAATD